MRIKVFFFLFLINFQNVLIAEIKNNIVVKVEDEIITNYEIKNKILSTLILSNTELTQSNIDKLKSPSLNSLIDYKLKMIEMSKYNFNVTNAELNNYLNRISSNNIANLKKKFKNNNLNYQLFIDQIIIELKWKKFIFSKYNNKVDLEKEISDKELKEIIEKKSNVVEYKISEIEIFYENRDSIKEKVNEILDSITLDGFKKTVKKYSVSDSALNNGDLGWIKSNMFSKEVYDSLKNTNIGDISKPIIGSNNIIFLKVEDKKETNIDKINIEQIKEELIKVKQNELFRLYSNSYISQLRNNNLIEYR